MGSGFKPVVAQTIGKYMYYPADVIGKGSFGVVYKGTDKLGNHVAIKKIFIDEHPLVRNDRLIAIKKEAHIGKVINEVEKKSGINFIPDFYEIIEEENAVWLIMEYIEGVSLRAFLNTYKEKDIDKRISFMGDIMIQLAEKLAVLHLDASISHRDIKPENILLQPGKKLDKYDVYLVDFGLSCQLIAENRGCMKSKSGTISYMPPEIFNKFKDMNIAELIEANRKVDVWSLGVVFYEMITSKFPYSYYDTNDIAYKMINQSIIMTSINASLANVPAKMKKILKGMLTYDAHTRLDALSVSRMLQEPLDKMDRYIQMEQLIESDVNNQTQKNSGSYNSLVDSSNSTSEYQQEDDQDIFGILG